MERKEKIQIAFLVILLFAVFGLIFTGIKIVKYHDMLTNPLGYSLEYWNIPECTCYGSDGAFVVKAIGNTNTSEVILQTPFKIDMPNR